MPLPQRTNEEQYLGGTRQFHSFICHLMDYSEVVKTEKWYRPSMSPRVIVDVFSPKFIEY